MRKCTILLFFLLLGGTTLMAQNIQSVQMSSDFTISALSAKPSAGTILEFDISQFKFESAERAQRVIAGFDRMVKVDFAKKTGQIILPEAALNNPKITVEKVNRMLTRKSKAIKHRSTIF